MKPEALQRSVHFLSSFGIVTGRVKKIEFAERFCMFSLTNPLFIALQTAWNKIF